jgi:hypothetical protein
LALRPFRIEFLLASFHGGGISVVNIAVLIWRVTIKDPEIKTFYSDGERNKVRLQYRAHSEI